MWRGLSHKKYLRKQTLDYLWTVLIKKTKNKTGTCYIIVCQSLTSSCCNFWPIYMQNSFILRMFEGFLAWFNPTFSVGLNLILDYTVPSPLPLRFSCRNHFLVFLGSLSSLKVTSGSALILGADGLKWSSSSPWCDADFTVESETARDMLRKAINWQSNPKTQCFWFASTEHIIPKGWVFSCLVTGQAWFSPF